MNLAAVAPPQYIIPWLEKIFLHSKIFTCKIFVFKNLNTNGQCTKFSQDFVYVKNILCFWSSCIAKLMNVF